MISNKAIRTRKKVPRLLNATLCINISNEKFMKNVLLYLLVASFIQGCGTLDSKTILIDPGDDKEKIIGILGVPYDRQFEQTKEAWQYCVSGAGFGYNDHKIVWFTEGKVTGITTYRTSRSGCSGAVKTIRWEEAPDYILEVRER